MRDLTSSVMRIPDQFNPGDILLVIELVKMFNKQSFVLAFEVDDPQSPFLLGFVHFFHATMGLVLSVILDFLHMHSLLILSK
jgi:hypothetical protein